MIKNWSIFLEYYNHHFVELYKTNEALKPSQFRKYDTSNEKIIDTINKFWDILEIIIDDEDIKNLEKVIKLKNLKFSLLKEYDGDYIIKFNDSSYYINSKIYNKLLNNKNRI